VRVDHHVHLTSPIIQAYVPDYCRGVARFGPCDPALTTPRSTDDLLEEMDRGGIRRAVLVSNGYLAVSSMAPQREDAGQMLRAANEWTVEQALAHPDRFRAFIAVDPTRLDALAEIAHWRGRAGVTGIKLHLTASGSDFRDDGDVAALADVFRAAGEARWAILIHMRTRRMDYGAEDARRFLKEILPFAKGTPVQIAHVGGWGEVDAATLSALGAFADLGDADPDSLANVWFDLSGVVEASTPPETRAALASLVHRIGPRHFLAGSDWPFTTGLADLFGPTYPRIPISVEDAAAIRANIAPYAGD
jgi:predicted TIM-barrel fold metal-dependent hydrolase